MQNPLTIYQDLSARLDRADDRNRGAKDLHCGRYSQPSPGVGMGPYNPPFLNLELSLAASVGRPCHLIQRPRTGQRLCRGERLHVTVQRR